MEGIAAERAVGEECIDRGGPLAPQQLGCPRYSVGSISKIVNQDTNPVRNISYQHHRRVLTICDLGRASFLV